MMITDRAEMSISDKIERLVVIPSRIAEKEDNRKMLLAARSPDFGDKPSAGSKSNSSENKNIKYADIGHEIDELKAEAARLRSEIMIEIDERLVGEGIEDIDTRRILKGVFCSFQTLNYIGKKVIYRNYNYTMDLFSAGCERIAIPKKTIDFVRARQRQIQDVEKYNSDIE